VIISQNGCASITDITHRTCYSVLTVKHKQEKMMSTFEQDNENYDVKEISFVQMQKIMQHQARRQERRLKRQQEKQAKAVHPLAQ